MFSLFLSRRKKSCSRSRETVGTVLEPTRIVAGWLLCTAGLSFGLIHDENFLPFLGNRDEQSLMLVGCWGRVGGVGGFVVFFCLFFFLPSDFEGVGKCLFGYTRFFTLWKLLKLR